MRIPRFRTTRQILGPSWLTSDGESELVGYSLDIVKDAFVERTRLGALARLPFNDPAKTTTCPADALVEHGRTRRVIRGKFESDLAYAQRLTTWLDDSRMRGSAFGMLLRLREYVGRYATPNNPYFYIYTTRNRYSLLPSLDQPVKEPTAFGWAWDSSASSRQWARFWVVIWCGSSGLATNTPADYGDADAWYGKRDLVYGAGTITESDVAALKRIIREWKPAGTKCVSLCLDFTPGGPSTTIVTTGDYRGWGKNTSGVYTPHRTDLLTYTEGL